MQTTQGGNKRPHLTKNETPLQTNDAGTVQNEKNKNSPHKTTQNKKGFKRRQQNTKNRFEIEGVDSALNTRTPPLGSECFSQHLAIDLPNAKIEIRLSFSGAGMLVAENAPALLQQLLI